MLWMTEYFIWDSNFQTQSSSPTLLKVTNKIKVVRVRYGERGMKQWHKMNVQKSKEESQWL